MAWNDIVGHDVAKRIFRAHLVEDRVPNAYLLAGPEGIGKRQLALEMAKALNCAMEGERPCDACSTCQQITKGTHPDLHLMEPSGTSVQIRIDEVRHVLGRIALRPFSARTQVVIVDGAERLTEEAANSVLKSLEEPHPTTRFLLVTAHLPQCLPTITSRCQVIRCRPLPPAAIQRLLLEQQACGASEADAIARLCAGSFSRARELASRWERYQSDLSRLAAPGFPPWLETPLPETRQEVAQLLDVMIGWLRDLTLVSAGGPGWVAHAIQHAPLAVQAAAVDRDRCIETAVELFALRESMEQFVSPRLVASLAREKWLALTAV